MTKRQNISPEIEAAIAEGREMGLREAAALVSGLKQRFVPWLFRGLGDVPETDAEGWGDMKPGERDLMLAASRAILRLIDGSPMPEHKHAWSEGDDPVCAICGQTRQSTAA